MMRNYFESLPPSQLLFHEPFLTFLLSLPDTFSTNERESSWDVSFSYHTSLRRDMGPEGKRPYTNWNGDMPVVLWGISLYANNNKGRWRSQSDPCS
ncbi:hypothetical protein TNCV_2102501 [Trichonephila clavipes]|nr:hypothetical protein TNCV_2102501 [Trichonephila clavipes]